jgi:hypothetical protein
LQFQQVLCLTAGLLVSFAGLLDSWHWTSRVMTHGMKLKGFTSKVCPKQYCTLSEKSNSQTIFLHCPSDQLQRHFMNDVQHVHDKQFADDFSTVVVILRDSYDSTKLS